MQFRNLQATVITSSVLFVDATTNGLLTRAFVCRARSQIFPREIYLRSGTYF